VWAERSIQIGMDVVRGLYPALQDSPRTRGCPRTRGRRPRCAVWCLRHGTTWRAPCAPRRATRRPADPARPGGGHRRTPVPSVTVKSGY
jgi:hypothetical protein